MSDAEGPQRPALARLQARVEGRVQGVGFRYQAASTARRLRLTGYVRNRPDGSVETVAEGAVKDVERYLQWLQRGPAGAAVTAVDARTLAYQGDYRSFSVEY